MSKDWQVQILDEQHSVVHVIDCDSEHEAQKVERGVLRQLDTERFFTEVVPKVRAAASMPPEGRREGVR